MDEAPVFHEAAALAPDRLRAIYALGLASEMLSLARERYAAKDYARAFEESCNAIRMASSAIMMMDGYVSGSLDEAAAYLLRRYPGVFPVEEWVRLEEMPREGSPGLYNMLMSAMGKVKKTGEQEAREALLAAEAFISSAGSEMGI